MLEKVGKGYKLRAVSLCNGSATASRCWRN